MFACVCNVFELTTTNRSQALILNCCLWVPTFCSRSVLSHMSTWLLLESHKCSIGIACQCMAYKVASFNWTQMVQQYCMPFALACTSLDTWAFTLRPALVLLSFILICVAGCLTFENQESIRSPHTINVNSTLNFLKEEIFRLEGHNSLYVLNPKSCSCSGTCLCIPGINYTSLHTRWCVYPPTINCFAQLRTWRYS